MEHALRIRPPDSSGDTTGAVRVFQEFLQQYREVLARADEYFEHAASQFQPLFSDVYTPWRRACRDLLHSAYVVARKMPLPNPKALAEALRLLSMDSAAAMLHDICLSCQIRVSADWIQSFRENIRTLNAAFRVLLQQKVLGRAVEA